MTKSQRFLKKHVFITGSARGIGFEIARQFALEGAVLSLLDFNSENLDKASRELQQITAAIFSYEADVSDNASVKHAVADAERRQSIDILINNAGIAL
jgi:3-hydroxybutyrate dehydrogenase